MNQISLPSLGEHICFCGTTGSGKSYLAQRMLEFYGRYFVFDTHGSIQLPDSVKVSNPTNLRKKLVGFDKIRYVPALDYRTRDWYNEVIRKLMLDKAGKGRIIYIDEIFHLGYGPSFPDWLSRGISTARQRKTSVWVASQRPMNIPMAILTEATKIYCFYLAYEDDIDKLSKFTRDRQNFKGGMRELKYDHSFIEIDRVHGTWRKLPKLGG